MKKAINIAKRELAGHFSSPVAFLFLGAFLFITLFIFFWVSAFFSRNIADVRPLFQWMPVLLVFLVGALTMRMWSEERRAGTVEFLMTLPVPSFQLVLGKFLACITLVILALSLTLPLPFTVSSLGDLDWGPVFGAYLASIFLAGAYISIGLYVSAKNDNQIVSLIVTVLLCLTLYVIGSSALMPYVGNQGAEILQLLGSGSRFESITRGVLDLRDVYYYVSIMGIFLSLNVYALERLRWSEGGQSRAPAMWRNLTALLCLNFLAANFWLQNVSALRVDLTESQMYSISEASRNYLQQLQEPLLIRGYFSDKTHPLLAPLVPQLRDLIKEYEVVSKGKVRSEFVDPRENPDLEEEANQKYGIKPVPFQIPGRHEVSLINSYFDILVQYGDKYEVVSFQDLIEVKFRGESDIEVRLRNPEYDITKTIKKVLYGFQTTENLFQSLSSPVTLREYISPAENLPKALSTFQESLKNVTEEIKKISGDKFIIETLDPGDPSSAIAQEIDEKYGFRPMMTSLFSDKTFYFYLLLESQGRVVPIPLPEDLTDESAKRTIESALKRFSPDFIKTVGLVEPPKPEGQQFNPMMQQGSKGFRILQERLGEGLTVKTVNLDNGTVSEDIDLLLLAAPQNLSEKALFAVDQFLMKGGTTIVLTSPYAVSRTQSDLSREEVTSGLEDWLKKYGISLKKELVLDKSNEHYPVPVQRDLGGFRVQEIRQVPYPPFVDVRSEGMNQDSLITSGIPQVTLNWSSPIEIDAEKAKPFQVTELLHSSKESWSSDVLKLIPNFQAFPESGFPPGDYSPSLLGVVLEGSFPSYFQGKDSPLVKKDETTTPPVPGPDGETPQEKEVISGTIERSPESARIILFSSNEFVTDQTLQISASSGTQQFLNSLQLIQNAIDWSLEDRGLLSIRSRGSYNRTLYPLEENLKLKWEYANYSVALLGLLLIYAVYRELQKRKRAYHLALIQEITHSNGLANGLAKAGV
ncbi:MAG: Gldg family protein [Bdellovibrionales bacterium]|nr:Gldg family protein [Bdellovibrionales bacterium]